MTLADHGLACIITGVLLIGWALRHHYRTHPSYYCWKEGLAGLGGISVTAAGLIDLCIAAVQQGQWWFPPWVIISVWWILGGGKWWKGRWRRLKEAGGRARMRIEKMKQTMRERSRGLRQPVPVPA